MTYDTDNVFAKILSGEMPSHKVYEDEKTFVFMDIMPRSEGHTLVIPKSPARNILDVAPDDLSAVMATVQKISKASLEAFEADGITIQQFNEEAAGQIVFHLHFHILPRRKDVPLGPPGEVADNDVLAQHAKKLKAVL